MFYTDDPVADFHSHDAEQERKLDKLPECYECGNKIQSEYCYEINGEYICEECLKENHRKLTDDVEGW